MTQKVASFVRTMSIDNETETKLPMSQVLSDDIDSKVELRLCVTDLLMCLIKQCNLIE